MSTMDVRLSKFNCFLRCVLFNFLAMNGPIMYVDGSHTVKKPTLVSRIRYLYSDSAFPGDIRMHPNSSDSTGNISCTVRCVSYASLFHSKCRINKGLIIGEAQ
jgi:hypothetical protein